ncbi:MAG: hypothetical protein C0412_15970, partial [Flavobacterium sp.]|nr:hypothetical protein [Flavobacterium sp.]
MKILIITPRIPYPPFRGDKLKIYNISRLLAKNNEVTVVTFIVNKNETEYVDELGKIGLKVHTVYLPKYKSFLNLVRSIFSFNPLQVSYFYSGQMKQKIRELTSENEYDVVYFHLLVTMQYFKDILSRSTLRVADFTDSISLYLSRYVKMVKNPILKFAYYYELFSVRFYEKKAKQFDTLFICSDADKKSLEKRDIHNNIQILLNGINLETFSMDSIKPEKNRIIFSGNMPYFPNSDAVFFFAKEIFPLIVEKIPDCKFYIVGQNPSAKILALKSDNIIVTGFVEDIRKEYLLSEVNVAPIRFGAGTLNKIIEAMGLGVPTVATSLSIEGFPAELKKYIKIGNSPKEFADRVVEILTNPEYKKEMVEEGAP